MKTTFEAVLAALLARDNEYPSDLEQKNMVRAEFLRGAATAFALCWRGEESSQCLQPDAKAYGRARRLMANWMAAKVMKAARVSARFS